MTVDGFEHVVVGIDSSTEGIEAARQAERDHPRDARLWRVSVWDPGLAMHVWIHATTVTAERREQPMGALRDASQRVAQLEPIRVRGTKVAALRSER